jgi:hypothetical protein
MFTRNLLLLRLAQVRRNALATPPSCPIQPRIQALIMAKSKGNATVRHLLAAAYRDLRDQDFFLIVSQVGDVDEFERRYIAWVAECQRQTRSCSMSTYAVELAARLQSVA